MTHISEETRGKTLARHYDLMVWVLNQRLPWCVYDVQQAMQVNIRSAYRYIGALMEAGIIHEAGKINSSWPLRTYWKCPYRIMRRDDVTTLGPVMRVAAPALPSGGAGGRLVN